MTMAPRATDGLAFVATRRATGSKKRAQLCAWWLAVLVGLGSAPSGAQPEDTESETDRPVDSEEKDSEEEKGSSSETARSLAAGGEEPQRLTVPSFEGALRHVDCSGQGGFWARARRAQLAEYCHALTRAGAALWVAPRRIRQDVEQALSLMPAGAEAHLLAAEWQLSMQRPQSAHESFERIFDRQSQHADSEGAGRTLPAESTRRVSAARAALLAGEFERSLVHYRASVLSPPERMGARERARVFIEAAAAASYLAPPRYREAEAYLRQASREQAPLLEPVVSAARRLLASRAGKSLAPPPDEEAQFSLAWIFERVPAPRGVPHELLPVLPRGEQEALVAIWSDAASWEEAADSWGEGTPDHILAHARDMAAP